MYDIHTSTYVVISVYITPRRYAVRVLKTHSHTNYRVHHERPDQYSTQIKSFDLLLQYIQIAISIKIIQSHGNEQMHTQAAATATATAIWSIRIDC